MNHPTPFHRRSADAGFTIIELMIVLGIAALILAGVLIAVPALQRNQRNGARRTDVNFVQSQMVTYQGNNQGAMPDSIADFTASITNNNDDSSYYATGTNSWSAAGDWNLINTVGAATAHTYVNGAATAVTLAAGNAATDADEFDIWIDGGDATNAVATLTDPGFGVDPLPDQEHFDVFIGFTCANNNYTPNPANELNYPNDGNLAAPSYTASSTDGNFFVNEGGLARNFAIVYRLEGENIWYCQDNA